MQFVKLVGFKKLYKLPESFFSGGMKKEMQYYLAKNQSSTHSFAAQLPDSALGLTTRKLDSAESDSQILHRILPPRFDKI